MPDRDYSAFTHPVSKREVADFRRAWKSARPWQPSAGSIIAVIIVGVVLLMFSGTIVFVVTVLASTEPVIVPVLIGGAAILGAGVTVGAVVLTRVRWRRRLRQSRFAAANGLEFSVGGGAPDYPGAIFHHGSSRRLGDHYRRPSGRALDFGNYQYTTGGGKNQTTHRWGFLALRLDRPLPHMVLDSTANNGLFGGTNLPTEFRRDQVLSLEGDFDRYFRLYCPREYERDALYVFTPDLMAILIDNAARFDVEIVDDWLFVYSSTPFALDEPRTIEQLLRIVDTVGEKALTRTDRYVDERAMSRTEAGFTIGADATGSSRPPSIAPGGRRLRRRFPLVAVILLVGGFIAFQFVRVLVESL